MSANQLKKEYVEPYLNSGEERFYRSMLLLAIKKLILIETGTYKGTLPHIEYILCYQQLVCLSRQEGNDTFLKVAKAIRKVAHKIYRIMLKKNMTIMDDRFLNLV